LRGIIVWNLRDHAWPVSLSIAACSAFWFFRENPRVPWSGLITDRSVLILALVPLVYVVFCTLDLWLGPKRLLRNHHWLEDLARENRELKAELETDKTHLAEERREFERVQADYKDAIPAMIEDAQATIKQMRDEDEAHRQAAEREIKAKKSEADRHLAKAKEAQAKSQETDVRDQTLTGRENTLKQQESEFTRREQGIRSLETELAEQKKAIQAQLAEAGETLAKAKKRATAILDGAEQAAKDILARAEKPKEVGTTESQAVGVDQQATGPHSLDGFISAICVVGTSMSVQSSDLFQTYRNWATRNGVTPLSSNAFAATLGSLGFGKTKTKKCNLWRGIGLREEPGWRPDLSGVEAVESE
jgi:Poxvirus D5 protein-like